MKNKQLSKNIFKIKILSTFNADDTKEARTPTNKELIMATATNFGAVIIVRSLLSKTWLFTRIKLIAMEHTLARKFAWIIVNTDSKTAAGDYDEMNMDSKLQIH